MVSWGVTGRADRLADCGTGSLGGMLMGMFGFGGKAKGEGKEEL